MATSPNFSWPEPDNTDLVKNGALAIRTAVDAIDASMVDLKGGTTGQVLSKASNTDMDFTWVTDAAGDITGVTAGTGISGGGTSGTVTVTNSMATAIDAKGDLIGGTGADTFARLAVGANGTILTADSAEATGMKWAAAAGGGGMTLISTTTLSGASTTISVSSNSYKNLVMFAEGIDCSNDVDVFIQLNGETGATAYVPASQGSNQGTGYTNYARGNGIFLNLTGTDGFGTSSDNFSNITLYNANSTIRKVIDVSVGSLHASSSRVSTLRSTVTVGSSAVISSIVFKLTSPYTFDAGTIKLYGVS